MVLRTARPEEAGWIDEQYRRAGFIPSDVTRDTIVIAELDGTRAGLGRLVPAGANTYELGGMFVDDRFRGRGVARAIVDELLRRAGDADVYCIPFADLEALYAASGFRRAEEAQAPEKVREKLAWCRRELTRAVILMRRATT